MLLEKFCRKNPVFWVRSLNHWNLQLVPLVKYLLLPRQTWNYDFNFNKATASKRLHCNRRANLFKLNNNTFNIYIQYKKIINDLALWTRSAILYKIKYYWEDIRSSSESITWNVSGLRQNWFAHCGSTIYKS